MSARRCACSARIIHDPDSVQRAGRHRLLDLDQAMLVAVELYQVGQNARRFGSQHVGFILFGGFTLGVAFLVAFGIAAFRIAFRIAVRVAFQPGAVGCSVAGIGIRRHFAGVGMSEARRTPRLGLFTLALALALQQRDAGALVEFAEPLEVIDQFLQFFVRFSPRQVLFTRLWKQRRQIGDSLIIGFVDAAPGQRVVQRAFTVFLRIAEARQRDVGRYAAQLGGAAVDAEELGHGELDLAQLLLVVSHVVVQVEQVLHGSLAERGFTEDDAATVVLYGRGEDLRRRSARAVDQHRQRTVPGHARFPVGFDRDPAVGVAHLDYRPGIDEQSGHGGRLDQRTAAVAAQVNDDALDAVGAQFVDQSAHVASAGTVVRLVAGAAAEVDVEHRHVDDADLGAAVAGFDFLDRRLGGLFLELDLIAHDVDDFRRTLHAGLGRQNLEPHQSLAFTPDQVDHVVQAPADHVDEFLVALGHTDDAVAGL